MENKTPLYERHVDLGGSMVPFGGFLLPVQYPTGIIAEHKAVREYAGIFDVSHMGEAVLSGPDALANLNGILTNDFTAMPTGAARYSLMLYENGGTVDDLIVYRLSEERFLLVLNASNTEKDIAWLRARIAGNVQMTDLSAATAQIALQGPRSKEILSKLSDESGLPGRYYSFKEHCRVAGADCLVSRTGYTGEFGYELYMAPEHAAGVWDALKMAGAAPCGLGARDTLRLEAAMPLYGHEIDETIDPLTAGLGFAVRLDKPDFTGKSALLALGTPALARVGLKVVGRGIVREHEDIFADGGKIGRTTSGTYCPYIGVACAMAYVDKAFSRPGTEVAVEVRGRMVAAEVVALPFYSRTKKIEKENII